MDLLSGDESRRRHRAHQRALRNAVERLQQQREVEFIETDDPTQIPGQLDLLRVMVVDAQDVDRLGGDAA